MSTGTIVLTGANGTLGLAYVKAVLKDFQGHHAVLTVRNEDPSDVNTTKLKETIAAFPDAQYSIYTLDLASLDSVRSFASTITGKVASGELPAISTIMCNAFAWSITNGLQLTGDGYELSFQVNHLSHFALVLQLLGSIDKSNGRIVVLSSDSHYPRKNALEQFPPVFPEDIEKLAKPEKDVSGEEVGRGFQRYGLSKLCVVMFAYELARRLRENSDLRGVTVVASDPGGIPDSRAMAEGVPKLWGMMMKYVLNPLQPVLKYAAPLRKSAEAGRDLAHLSLGRIHPGKSGYYTMMKIDKSSPESYEEEKWRLLWKKSVEWSGIKPTDTILLVD
ncbi:short-chain dehydrogenase/reductase-like protein sdr [Collybia nuda]|uniref:3beta-hydroxysteroid 3-dehydrogenase n=1 Tax=Collybia nuda TaxID=64659 RepID=A0A9P5YB73_9AGAR|nr:short-chain dehydrogenase/reductase-like protein sdr [Collybia nuda]